MDTTVATVNTQELTTAELPDNNRLLSYILDKLDRLAEYPVYIDNAITQISALAVNESPMGGEGDAARANAIGNSVAAREETNRALIEFLKQIYNDVKPVNPQIYTPTPQDSQKSALYQSIAALIDRIDPDNDNATDLLDTARNMLR